MLQWQTVTWTANVLTDIDEALSQLEAAWNSIEPVILASIEKYNEIVKALMSNRSITTWTPTNMNLAWGYSAIQYTYNGKTIKVIAHAYVLKDRIFVTDFARIKKVLITDSSYMNDGWVTLEKKWFN